MTRNQIKGLAMTRNQIKGLAVFTMFCNHSAAILLKADTVLFTLCINIGYFTAPIMCWFLVEGYAYTHSKWQYGLRLLLIALISELPFQLAFHRMGNMLFTLFLCFLILFVREQIQNRDLSYLMQGGLVLLTGFCDWPVVAGIYTILFSISYRRSKSILKTFGIATLIFLFVQYRNVGVFDASVVLSGMSVFGAGLVLYFGYQGQQGTQKWCQWFFYLFYPLHLLVLWVISLI